TAKNPRSSAGWRAISSMRVFSSARVAGATRGTGLEREVTGEGIGVGVGAATRRSSSDCAKLTRGIGVAVNAKRKTEIRRTWTLRPLRIVMFFAGPCSLRFIISNQPADTSPTLSAGRIAPTQIESRTSFPLAVAVPSFPTTMPAA
ncbi:MAG: hypothetical protein QOE96_1212, partial [Blastocatellia bacterium]|nr:hypothetical protein [Blastocatellia bacterium]